MERNRTIEKIIGLLFFFGILVLSFSSIKQPPARSETNQLTVSFLDVGQGDATLIKTPKNKYILVDGGPDKSVLSKLGEEMPPTVSEIEAVILSHPHADHVSALNYVLERYKVKKAYLTGVSYNSPDYKEFLRKLVDLKIPAEKYYEGKNIYIDDLDFKAFWPPADSYQIPSRDMNDNSIAFSVAYGKNSIFFLGDLSAKKQEEMIAREKIKKADIIKISHHGSKTGTSENLLNLLQPEYAVIFAGRGNSYGHPHPSSLSQLSAQKILRTDQEGTIRFSSDGNTFKLLR